MHIIKMDLTGCRMRECGLESFEV